MYSKFSVKHFGALTSPRLDWARVGSSANCIFHVSHCSAVRCRLVWNAWCLVSSVTFPFIRNRISVFRFKITYKNYVYPRLSAVTGTTETGTDEKCSWNDAYLVAISACFRPVLFDRNKLKALVSESPRNCRVRQPRKLMLALKTTDRLIRISFNAQHHHRPPKRINKLIKYTDKTHCHRFI